MNETAARYHREANRRARNRMLLNALVFVIWMMTLAFMFPIAASLAR